MNLKCNKCLNEFSTSNFYKSTTTKRGYSTHCKKCKDEGIEKWRRENPEKVILMTKNWVKNNGDKLKLAAAKAFLKYPEKNYARKEVKRALRMGMLVKKPCSVCGTEENVQAHHASYSRERWLDVDWLCVTHHSEEHKRLNSIAGECS